MVDPLSIATGVVTGQAAAILREQIEKYFKGGSIDRLLRLLDQRFGAHTGLSLSQLQTWTADERFRVALFFVGEGEWDEYRPLLREAVMGQIAADPNQPERHEADLADEIVAAIEELLPQAKEGDELARYHHAQTQESIRAANVRAVQLDWAPERAKKLIEELIQQEPAQGAQLDAALKSDSGTAVRGLVRQPPSWTTNGSGHLWAAIAAVAESHGFWEEAQQAWERAADRPGGDRVRAHMRARLAARVQGAEQRAAELLTQARSVDPAHPLVLIVSGSVYQPTWKHATPSGGAVAPSVLPPQPAQLVAPRTTCSSAPSWPRRGRSASGPRARRRLSVQEGGALQKAAMMHLERAP